jgi:hypothetical protein
MARDVEGVASISSLRIEGTDDAPGLAAVDQLARWVLDTTRAGGRVVIEYLAPELAELLDLAGLRVEVQGKTEGGEEAHWVQRVEEEGELGDFPT